MKKIFIRIALLLVALAAVCVPQPAKAAWDLSPASTQGLTDLSLEELSNIKITSVSKRPENLFGAPAAVTVITAEDIRRSGFENLPEVLRLAPGLEVAEINSSQWAVSSRGFNGPYATKLLVLMDGRSVYTPFFSGVLWDVQDTILEDLDRIEVVRGPGGTLYGANAVNGVINIVSKSAKETQGLLFTSLGGNVDEGTFAARYGGRLGENTYFRVYAKYRRWGEFENMLGEGAGDDSDQFRTGFRVDSEPSRSDLLTLQGDFYWGRDNYLAPLNGVDLSLRSPYGYDLAGGNVLGRWRHTYDDDSELTVQAYYDWNSRDEIIPTLLSGAIHTVDFDAQYHFKLASWNEIVTGLGYRLVADSLSVGPLSTINESTADRSTYSFFLQDTITVVPERLHLTLGSKVEHNDFTGFEVQPNARLAWTPTDKHTVWLSVARAVRTPSRLERDLSVMVGHIPGLPPTEIDLLGNPGFDSEELIAYEAGYRWKATSHLSFDLAAFYNDYDKLRATATGLPVFEFGPPPAVVIPTQFANSVHGETHGVELAANLSVTSYWRLNASYTWLDLELKGNAPGLTPAPDQLELSDPQNQFRISSYLNLPWDLEWDNALYYVDKLPFQGVDGYVRFDTRLGWRPNPHTEFSVGVRNLFDDRHREFGETGDGFATPANEVPRTYYGKATLRF